MATHFKLVAVLLFLFGLGDLQAQQQNIRLGILGLAYGRTNLIYEREISDNKSLNLQLGIQIPRSFPSGIDQFDQRSKFIIKSGKYTAGVGIATDLRFYTRAKTIGQTGFYFAPYLGYNYNQFRFEGEYTIRDGSLWVTNPDLYQFNTHSMSTGVKLGIRWIIDDHLAIDFNYFGLGFGTTLINASFQSTDPTEDYQTLREELDSDINELWVYLAQYKTTATPDEIKITGKFMAPVLKFSCSFGYSF